MLRMFGGRLVITFFVILVLASGCSRLGEQPNVAFDRFRDSIDAENLGGMSAEIATSSKEYFRVLESWVYDGDKEGLVKLKPFDLYLVLRIRMLRTEWDERAWLVAKQGSELLEEGTLHPLWFPLIQIDFIGDRVDRIDYLDGGAGGSLYANGRQLKTRLRFENEDSWKIDLVGYFHDRYVRDLRPFMGDEFRNRNRVEEYLKATYGESFTRELYLPRVAKD